MAATTVHVSIAVNKGSPVDYQRYRHTALYIIFTNGEPSALVNAVGPPQEFEFEAIENYDPTQTLDLAKLVEVGLLSVPTSRAQMIEILRSVSIRNHDREFNCQTWVEAALRRLSDLRMLSSDLYTKGVDGMVDAISEAEYEED